MFCGFSVMASRYKRTAYVYRVPYGTSESVLESILNSSSQPDCSILVDKLNQGVAILKISGNGLYDLFFNVWTRLNVFIFYTLLSFILKCLFSHLYST